MKFDIWKECPKVPLPSVLLTVVDNRGKTVPTAPSGHKLIATNCVRNENLYPVYEKIRYLSEETYRTWFRAHPEPGDIIFVCKGTPGRVCLVPDPIDFCIAQDMVALRADPKIVYNKYLLAVLRSFQIQEQILSTSVGDVIPHFKKSFFDQIMIPIPNMDIQKSIGDFYYTISEKTELNKKINDNLEQQAATYFQELFINNANPMWQISTISDLGTVVGGSTPSKTKPEYYTNNGIAWITPKDLSINKSKFISHGENDITELGLKNSSATVMPKGTVLFSSRAPIGYIAIASNEVTTNQGFKSVIPYSEIGTAFVYFFLKHSLPVIESAASGSTFKEISGSAMKNIPAIIPDRNTLDQFNSFCAPIFAQQKILEEQNHSLAMLRDSLLPKLMSSAIDIASIQL
ncbi:restriction endonuclease subunit S [Faecalibacterium prausnitzii]|uniref:restriction endonuclease subunit S n=1 Tax=Faecalibacterium prausnitzii TaxID=853 RepID=UPI001CBE2313|nr:restriction endonuclease subunit S [Faecalibacterium prausnitzii]